jgi:hypothetical protein
VINKRYVFVSARYIDRFDEGLKTSVTWHAVAIIRHGLSSSSSQREVLINFEDHTRWCLSLRAGLWPLHGAIENVKGQEKTKIVFVGVVLLSRHHYDFDPGPVRIVSSLGRRRPDSCTLSLLHHQSTRAGTRTLGENRHHHDNPSLFFQLFFFQLDVVVVIC